MSTRLRDVLMQELEVLRHEPTEKRIRGVLGEETIVDSTRALLVWEPKRVVASYAVPVEDVRGEIAIAASGDAAAGEPTRGAPMLGDRPVLDPSVPFAVHTADGEALWVRGRAAGRQAAAFRPSDDTLAGFVILDFAGLDAWFEEDERNVGHPRDPFHRIDIVHSSRNVRVELDGDALAESSRPCMLFEPPLPVRYYLPPEDVRVDLMRRSDTRTFCAYKGQASYWSLPGADDVAWSYPEPLREASEVTGRVAFLNERVDILVDGALLDRPVTPWSRREAAA
jgi:uncharacterized protein (DUF427 family)